MKNHMNKNLTILAIVILMLIPTLSGAQRRVSVLGDSYSTFSGWIKPSWNYCWYKGADKKPTAQNDVEYVEQTWWHQLLKATGDTLEINNSFSGSTVCCTGYRQEDYSDRSFIARALHLGNPDIILVFGGTNDSWAQAPVGEYQYGAWTAQSLYAFRPAFAQLMTVLLQYYPNATIYNITNSELSKEVTESMDIICRHYGVKNILLHDIDKQSGHPSVAGMKAIAEQVKAVMK